MIAVLGVALLSAAAAPSAPSSSSGLYVVSAAGGKSRKVVDACVESFAWSPDATGIALDAFSQHIRLIAPTGRKLKTLTTTNTGLDAPVLWFSNGNDCSTAQKAAMGRGLRASTPTGPPCGPL